MNKLWIADVLDGCLEQVFAAVERGDAESAEYRLRLLRAACKAVCLYLHATGATANPGRALVSFHLPDEEEVEW